MADEFFPYKESIPKKGIRSALKPLSLGVANEPREDIMALETPGQKLCGVHRGLILVSDHSKPFEVACDDCDTKPIELGRLAVNSRIEDLKKLS